MRAEIEAALRNLPGLLPERVHLVPLEAIAIALAGLPAPFRQEWASADMRYGTLREFLYALCVESKIASIGLSGVLSIPIDRRPVAYRRLARAIGALWSQAKHLRCAADCDEWDDLLLPASRAAAMPQMMWGTIDHTGEQRVMNYGMDLTRLSLRLRRIVAGLSRRCAQDVHATSTSIELIVAAKEKQSLKTLFSAAYLLQSSADMLGTISAPFREMIEADADLGETFEQFAERLQTWAQSIQEVRKLNDREEWPDELRSAGNTTSDRPLLTARRAAEAFARLTGNLPPLPSVRQVPDGSRAGTRRFVYGGHVPDDGVARRSKTARTRALP